MCMMVELGEMCGARGECCVWLVEIRKVKQFEVLALSLREIGRA